VCVLCALWAGVSHIFVYTHCEPHPSDTRCLLNKNRTQSISGFRHRSGGHGRQTTGKRAPPTPPPTNSTGDYCGGATGLGPIYTVNRERKGLSASTFYQHRSYVAPGKRALDCHAENWNIAQRVEVSSTAILLQDGGLPSTVRFSTARAGRVPSNSRRFLAGAQLDPNVEPHNLQEIVLANRGGFIVAGITSANNNYLLDGSDDNDWNKPASPRCGHLSMQFQEFKIIHRRGPQEFGRRNAVRWC